MKLEKLNWRVHQNVSGNRRHIVKFDTFIGISLARVIIVDIGAKS
jgi:hypothetical protein